MRKLATTIAVRTAFIVSVLGVTTMLAFARTNPTDTTFACEGLDLKVDSKTTYNGLLMPKLSWSLKDLKPGVDHFFKFDDVKPGDTGTTTMSLHLKKSSAWMCLDFVNLKDKDNGNNEPESLADVNGTASGELSKGIEFFAWRDDGDNKFEIGEKPIFGTSSQSAFDVLNKKTYTLADSKHGPAWSVNKTRYVGVTWCAGNLTVNTATASITCNGNVLGNEAQTDSFSVDIVLRALPSQENPKFVCNPGKVVKGDQHERDKDKDDDKDKGKEKDEKRDDDDYDDDHGKKYSWYKKQNNWWGWSR